MKSRNNGIAMNALTVFCAVLLYSGILCAAAPTSVTVQLFDLVYLSGEKVILGEIASLEGDPQTLRQLQLLQIGTELQKEESRIITVEDIEQALPTGIKCSYPDASVVEVHSNPGGVEYSHLLSALQRRFTSFCGDSLNCQLELGENLPELPASKAGPLSCSIQAKKLPSYGHQVVTVDYVNPAGSFHRYQIPVVVKLYAQAIFFNQPLHRDEILTTDNIRRQTVDLSKTGISDLVFNPEPILGWKVSRRLTGASPLRWSQIEPLSVIEKGAEIELVVGGETFQIRAPAIALEDGYNGERIWVRLEPSGKRLRARVLDHKSVTSD